MAESANDVNIHRRGRCGRKRKTTASVVNMIIRNTVKAFWKTSRELQSDLAVSGMILDPSTIRKRFLTGVRIARKPRKKQLLTPAVMKKRLHWAKNMKIVVQNCGKELYSPMNLTLKCLVIDLGTLEKVLVSQSEKHIFNKPLSILPRRCSEDFFSASGYGRLIPIEGMMNSENIRTF